jgi:hypothetical protein
VGQAACTRCGQPIRGSYYEANGNVVCGRCEAQLKWERTEGSSIARFLRAGFFGALAAALGSALYYGVAALTKMEFGLIAILVGFMVGGAVRYGSRGKGGWLYQGLAMFLTYASIVSTYVPIILKAISEQSKQQATAGGPGPEAQTAAAPAPEPAGAGGALLGLVIGVALLMALAFAAPFLAGFENIMGIIIIAIGLYEAWKINRRVELVITGPYQVAPAPQAPAGG